MALYGRLHRCVLDLVYQPCDSGPAVSDDRYERQANGDRKQMLCSGNVGSGRIFWGVTLLQLKEKQMKKTNFLEKEAY